MSNIRESLNTLMNIEGCVAAALVDQHSGLVLDKSGGTDMDFELAGASITDVVRAKLKMMSMLNIKEKIEDILITLDTQYHVIRPSRNRDGIFLYVVLRKDLANLALARLKTADVEKNLVI